MNRPNNINPDSDLGKMFELHSKGLCPGCGKVPENFRDSLSKKESQISGMCQACQDQIFVEYSSMDESDFF